MDREKNISMLVKINSGILKCYKEIIEIELSDEMDDKFHRIINIYKEISQYRVFEDQYFDKLKGCCTTKKKFDDLYAYILEVYQVSEAGRMFFENVEYLDYQLEVRRILQRMSREIEIPTDDFLNTFDFDSFISTLDKPFTSDVSNERLSSHEVSNEELLEPFVDEEDVVRFIQKIDLSLINYSSSENCFTREELCKLKYYLIFLNRDFEEMLINDYCILPSLFIDSKRRASLCYELSDEDVYKAYDNIREVQILAMAEDLSQARNQNDHFRNNLRYMIIDLWAEAIDGQMLSDIMVKLEDKAINSCNEAILNARFKVYDELYNKYENRILQYEVIEEEMDIAEILDNLKDADGKVYTKIIKGRRD